MTAATNFGLFVILCVTHSVNTNSEECASTCSDCRHGVCGECYYKYWGTACQKRCVDCWVGGCNKHTGRCIQCKPGRYTEECSKPCPHQCRLSYDSVRNCDRRTGECLEGCRKGLWGSKCDKTCSQGCSQDYCFQDNGGCFYSCKAGWYGKSCDRHNCRNGIPDNGECRNGCSDGWTGKTCTEKCLESCVTCNQYNETCTSCKDGLYGLQCESECSLTCLNNACDMTGRCVDGCENGFHGNSCKNACPPNCLRCEQETGSCTRCEIGFTGKECLAEDSAPEPYAQTEDTSPSSSKATTAVKTTSLTLIHMGIVIPYFISWG